MTKKRKKTTVGRVTLRVEPQFHIRLDKVGRDLGLTVNGVVNLLVARWLGRLELEAAAYLQLGGARTTAQLKKMEKWRRAKSGRTRQQYVRLKLRQLMREASSRAGTLPDLDGPPTKK
jgi:hypothetical protein